MEASEHPAVQRHVEAAVAEVVERMRREHEDEIHALKVQMVVKLAAALGREVPTDPNAWPPSSWSGPDGTFDGMLIRVRELHTGEPQEYPIFA